jgi:hypothetical protein
MEASSPQSNGSLLDPLGIEGKIKVPRTPRGSKRSDHGDGSRPMEDEVREEAQEDPEPDICMPFESSNRCMR